MLKKIITLYLPPLITIGLVLVRMSNIQALLNKCHQLEFLVYSFFVTGTVLNYIFAGLSPLQKFNKKEKLKWKRLDENADEFLKTYKEYDLGMNIMIVERRLFSSVEPRKDDNTKRKFKIFSRMFIPIWYRGKRVHPKLKLSINQGVCGSAYQEVEQISSAILLPEYLSQYQFNFTNHQLELTSELTIVVSCRIEMYEPNPDEQKLIILGVLNVESRKSGAEILLLDQQLKEKLYITLRNFCTLYANL